MCVSREMTLQEWAMQLPPSHRARKEYEEISDRLRQEMDENDSLKVDKASLGLQLEELRHLARTNMWIAIEALQNFFNELEDERTL